ncbi:sulfotransferase [Pseudooceanicola sp.]|uniref:sulfotransferase n=1 Tax=Pseudooceanicola sp. TaxID=1914328 RepID=UPI00261F0B0D|nr:sulfotransferase [Pseudooceanicola sp.]MDF1855604.1 sulfotransferase family protein [Pseudooceanicola sp.]
MTRLRVINLGLPKSGTTTLATALNKAGMKVADHKIRPAQTDNPALQRQFVGDVLYRGYFRTGDPLAELEAFDAITESSYLTHGGSAWPQMDFGLIEAIRAHHPGAKFVATQRRAKFLSRSMLSWTNMNTRLERADIPGLPHGYGNTTMERVTWIKAHYAHLRRLFRGRPEEFLLLDVAAEDAREQLSAFLGREIDWWGRANANPDGASDETEDDADGDADETSEGPTHA